MIQNLSLSLLPDPKSFLYQRRKQKIELPLVKKEINFDDFKTYRMCCISGCFYYIDYAEGNEQCFGCNHYHYIKSLTPLELSKKVH